MGFPFGEPVVRHVYGTSARDSDGNEVASFVDVPHTGVAVWPADGTETADGSRDTNVVRLILGFKPAIEASALDEFTVRGDRFKAVGAAEQFHSPFTGGTVTRIDVAREMG